jgi:hypothetical protein
VGYQLALALVKVRSALKYVGVALVVGAGAVIVLSNDHGSSRKVAASHLACAAATPGKPLAALREAYGSMGVAFSDRRGGALVGYERFLGSKWLCAVTTDSNGYILGAVRLQGAG